jgi:hypothetical protein
MTERAAPEPTATERALAAAFAGATRYLRSLPERPVAARAGAGELLARLGGPLPDGPSDPAEVVAQLAALADDGLVASAGPRYFGFVVGGSLPAALAADWLAATWDQNAGLFALGPAAATVEEVAAGWLTDLLGLPATVSTGFVTGGQMASFTGLAAARHHVLAAAGWDVESDGLLGAPPVEVVVGDERHVTIDAALRFLGLGSGRLRVVPADGQGRMDATALPGVLAACQGPAIVCAQAGNVNTGAVDPLPAICDAAHDHGAWVHVDGAFGLWAGRLGGHRRPQVAQRPLRQRARVRRPPRGPPGRLLHRGRLPDAREGGRARPRRLHPRVLAAGQGVPGVGGAAVPRPLRGCRHGRARLRPGSPLRHRPRGGRRGRGPQRGRPQPGAGPLL